MKNCLEFTLSHSCELALFPAGTFDMPGRNISVGLRCKQ
jgi:hypothetical protein